MSKYNPLWEYLKKEVKNLDKRFKKTEVYKLQLF